MTSFVLGLPFVDTSSPGPDTDPPTVPTVNAVTSITTTTATLNWNTSTDTGSGLGGYNVYYGGDFYKTIHDPTAVSLAVTGLTAGTPQSFTVRAWDLVGPPGNESADSVPMTFTTLTGPDTNPPSVPTGLVPTGVTATTVSMQFGASIDDESGLAGYNLYDGATLVLTLSSAATTVTVTGLSPVSTHTYSLTAFDAATPPNESAASNVVTITTSSTTSSYADLGAAGSGAVSTSTTSLTVTYSRAVAAGNTVLAAITSTGGTTGVTIGPDSAGNTWTVDAETANNAASGGKMDVALCRGLITTPVTTSTTIPITGPSTAVAAFSEAFSGFLSSPLDQTATNNTGATSAITAGPTGTLAQANELAVAAVSLLSTNVYNAGTGWTALGSAVSSGGTSQRYVALAKQLVSSTAAVSLSGTQNLASGGTLANNNYAAVLATYKVGTTGTPPVNTSPPTISGSPVVGSTLTGNTGTWNPSGSATYQWQQAPATNCAGNSTSSTYTPTAADVGKQLQLVVSEQNSYGLTAVTTAKTAAVTNSTGSNVSATLVPKTGAWLGVESTTASGQTGPTWAGATQFRDQVLLDKRWPDVVYNYYDYGTAGAAANAATFCKQAIAAGVIPMVGINPGKGVPSGTTFKTIASGATNSYADTWGAAMAGVPGKLFMSWGHESDRYFKQGNSLTTGCVATDYAAAWIQFYTRMNAKGATNVVRVLNFASPTAKVSGNAGFYVDGMYPGKAWTDWICADPYKAAGYPTSDTAFTSWNNVMGFLQQPARPWYADGLPYGLVETGIDLASERAALGSTGGFTDPVCVSWFTGTGGWISAMKSLNLRMVCYFNLSKAGDIAYAYLNNNATVRAAFASMANDPWVNQPHN